MFKFGLQQAYNYLQTRSLIIICPGHLVPSFGHKQTQQVYEHAGKALKHILKFNESFLSQVLEF